MEVVDQSFVYWMPLTDDCIDVAYYHIQFRVNNENGSSFITVDDNETLYIVDIANDLPPTGQPIYVFVSCVP